MAWKLQADGSYISDQCAFKAYLDGGVWRLQNLNVNDSDFMTFAEMLQFPGFPAGTLPNPYSANIVLSSTFSFQAGGSSFDGDLNLASGKSVKVGGVPVAGYLYNGTPYFRKLLTFSFLNGVSTNGGGDTHGISNLISNNRLLRIQHSGIYVPDSTGNGTIYTASGDSSLVTVLNVSNTNYTISRGGTVGQLNCKILIDYT